MKTRSEAEKESWDLTHLSSLNEVGEGMEAEGVENDDDDNDMPDIVLPEDEEELKRKNGLIFARQAGTGFNSPVACSCLNRCE